MTTLSAPVGTMKRCSKCGEVKPLDEFHRNKRNKRDGRQSRCRDCQREYNRQWYAANREAKREYGRQWHADNRDARREYLRQWHADNREAQREYARQWRADNRDYSSQWNANNRATNAARTNAEIAAEQARRHPDGTKRCRRCREELPLSDFSADRSNLDGLQKVCRACNHIRPDVIEYWEAHGIDADTCVYCGGPYEHTDHIRPLALGGPDEPWNLAPACANCNLRKSARPTHEWINEFVPADNVDAWLLDPFALIGAVVVAADTAPRFTGTAIFGQAA